MQGVHIIKPRTSVNLNNQILERAVTVVGKNTERGFYNYRSQNSGSADWAEFLF